VKRFKTGLTIVELLTVVAIMALLIGILLPSVTAVRTAAKEAKQQVQITTIELALTAFRNDDGDYPQSDWIQPNGDYCGAQKLAEALLGWDLLGFHPNSEFTSDGRSKDGASQIYISNDEDNLRKRKGPYLELATANVFKLGVSDEVDGLYRDCGYLKPDTFVLCDVFGIRTIRLTNGKNVKAGTPILYYKANTSSKSMESPGFAERIYDAYDNLALILLGKLTPDGTAGKQHKLITNDGFVGNNGEYFYNPRYKIIDPKIAIPWPYKSDSYILISAGADGYYGTADDITNF